MTRLAQALALATLAGCASGPAAPSASADAVAQRPNVLLLTVDDMHWNSLGVTGCKLPNITPNIDRLASEGLRFEHAFVTVAECQPCREAWFTGLYPHNSGAVGFQPIRAGVETLPCTLQAAGYLIGVINKLEHHQPIEQFCWDMSVDRAGRAPEVYYNAARDFFARAHDEERAFLLVANITDPHRPFPVDVDALRERRGEKAVQALRDHVFSRYYLTPAARYFGIDEVEIPAALEDIPAIRHELAGYYTAVHRADASIGLVLDALDESGARENTLVMFLSDHGMPFPFSKANCYPGGTRTPWIVRWPGRTGRGVVDGQHVIEGIDLMPTVLDALGLAAPPALDGTSFLGVIDGQSQPELDHAFTFYDVEHGGQALPMRAVMADGHAYIFNAWSDGEVRYRSNLERSPTWSALVRASPNNPQIAARLENYLSRPREELVNYLEDPGARVNLATRPEQQDRMRQMRARLHRMMKESRDPVLESFERTILSAAVDPDSTSPRKP